MRSTLLEDEHLLKWGATGCRRIEQKHIMTWTQKAVMSRKSRQDRTRTYILWFSLLNEQQNISCIHHGVLAVLRCSSRTHTLVLSSIGRLESDILNQNFYILSNPFHLIIWKKERKNPNDFRCWNKDMWKKIGDPYDSPLGLRYCTPGEAPAPPLDLDPVPLIPDSTLRTSSR